MRRTNPQQDEGRELIHNRMKGGNLPTKICGLGDLSTH